MDGLSGRAARGTHAIAAVSHQSSPAYAGALGLSRIDHELFDCPSMASRRRLISCAGGARSVNKPQWPARCSHISPAAPADRSAPGRRRPLAWGVPVPHAPVRAAGPTGPTASRCTAQGEFAGLRPRGPIAKAQSETRMKFQGAARGKHPKRGATKGIDRVGGKAETSAPWGVRGGVGARGGSGAGALADRWCPTAGSHLVSRRRPDGPTASATPAGPAHPHHRIRHTHLRKLKKEN